VRDDAGAERFGRAAAIAARDPNSDALLLILTPHATIDPLRTAELVGPLAGRDRPVLATWMWGAATPASLAVLNRAGISTFAGPAAAVGAFGSLWGHGETRGGLHEATTPATVNEQANRGPLGGRIVHSARRSGRTQLTGTEARQLLAAYSLPAAETQV